MVRNTGWMSHGPRIRNIALGALFAAVLTACGGGGGSGDGGAVTNNGNTGTGGNTAPSGDSGTSSGTGGATPSGDTGGSTPVKQAGTVTGKVSYDFVPTATRLDANGDLQAKLDYTAIEQRPVRHALVEVVSEDGTKVLGKTVTTEAGIYSIDVPADTRVYVRVTAQGVSGEDSAPDYLIKVRDNTAPEYRRSSDSAPLYSMRGTAFTTAVDGSQADLNAASGWGGSGYNTPRSAAPFAILDQIVTAAQKMRAAAPDVALPALNVFWSVNNRPGDGDIANGLISSSHYDRNPATKGLYLLGAENVDTDEYDASVVMHEFGHYVEYDLSRSDSFGGIHYQGDALDMTVAFSEGFGNAFSSMARDSAMYTDTVGPLQGDTGIALNLDAPSAWSYSAWFDEEAVGSALYGLYKSPEVGFAQIYRAMLQGQKNTAAVTSVFSFAQALRPGLSDAGKRVLDDSLSRLQVTGGALLDEWGTATLKGGWNATPVDSTIFPIFTALKPGDNGTSCTTTLFGGGNKLGDYGRLRLTVPAAGFYRVTLSPKSGDPVMSDYVIAVFRVGTGIAPLFTIAGTSLFNLPAAGDYVAYVVPKANTDFNATQTSLPVCVSASLLAGVQ
ncbi:hypothetical protein AWB71_02334 [Caballeronia peredens]|nr:hypothetical protein AWB71_02334 [Caballeronia peredens]